MYWDYASLKWEYRHNVYTRATAEYRFYCNCQAGGLVDGGEEDDIWWEAGRLDQPQIGDYDGIRASYAKDFRIGSTDGFMTARLDLQSGNSDGHFLSYLSGRLSVGYANDSLRISGFYFDGYGKEPSTYHIRTRYSGLMLEFL